MEIGSLTLITTTEIITDTIAMELGILFQVKIADTIAMELGTTNSQHHETIHEATTVMDHGIVMDEIILNTIAMDHGTITRAMKMWILRSMIYTLIHHQRT